MSAPLKPNATRDRLAAEPPSPLFSSASFSCFLNRSSLKFTTDGEMTVSFIIPAGAVDDALTLRYLASNPLPLTLTVEVSTDYLDDLEESEARLHAL